MRGLVLRCVLAGAGLVLVASAATALSTQAPTPFDQTLTLAGGEAAVDPDAPIATARYGDAPKRPVTAAATVDLAGAVSATPLAGGPSATTGAVQVAEARTPPAIQTLSAPRPRTVARVETMAEIRPAATTQGLVRSSTRRVQTVKIDDIEMRPFMSSGDRSTFAGVSVDASNLIGKMRPNSRDSRKGRWILFAATQGKSLSLNVVKDSIVGWRSAGWAEERVARFGTHQLGMGWRKNGRQLSLSATRRSLRAQDYSDRDMVYGISLSFNGR